MRLVYICSPLRGDMEANKKRADEYCAYRRAGVNRFGSSCGVFYGCRAVLTPEREKKRQNGKTADGSKSAVSRLFV